MLCETTAQAEIRIAVAGDMTGANAWFGEQYQRAAELAVENLNAKGGVLGQRVELIVGDDACDAEQAVALATNWSATGPFSLPAIFARTPRSRLRKYTNRRMFL
jgi:branched-chain amino acid transport system substrate-binding protein